MSQLNQELFQRILQGEYYAFTPFPVTLKGKAYTAAKKMGLTTLPGADYPARLIAEAIELSPTSQIMVFGCGDGLLPVVAASCASRGKVVAYEPSYISAEAARNAIKWNGCENVDIHFADPNQSMQWDKMDAVLINLPKGKQLVEAYITYAHKILGPGGLLYLAGSNSAGIKSYGAMVAKLYKDVQVLAYQKGCRVLRGVKGDTTSLLPDFTHEKEIKLRIKDQTLTLMIEPGVFAGNQLDPGSQLLLEAMEIHPEDVILDLGCGNGILGLAAAKAAPRGYATLVDSSIYALNCAIQSMGRNHIPNARVLASDVISTVRSELFDVVVTNPPFHSGIQADFATALAFIVGAAEVLKPGGRFYLVANRFLKYEPYLMQVFTKVERFAENRSYKVIVGIR